MFFSILVMFFSIQENLWLEAHLPCHSKLLVPSHYLMPQQPENYDYDDDQQIKIMKNYDDQKIKMMKNYDDEKRWPKD